MYFKKPIVKKSLSQALFLLCAFETSAVLICCCDFSRAPNSIREGFTLLLQAMFIQHKLSSTKRQRPFHYFISESSILSWYWPVCLCVFHWDRAPALRSLSCIPLRLRVEITHLILMRSSSIFPAALGIPPSLQEVPLERGTSPGEGVCHSHMWDLRKHDKVVMAVC